MSHDSFVSKRILLVLYVFMMNMLIWNCKGAGNNRFPDLIRDYVKMYKLGFLAIIEPHISGVRADNVINKLGFDGIARSDAITFVGGIWCLWKRNRIAIDVVSISKYYILLKVNPHSQSP